MQHPRESSLSARVIFPDHNQIKARLAELAQEAIAKDSRIAAIHLFGSRATGNFSARSDADLLIVLRHDERRPVDRIPDCLRLFNATPVPIDVFPFTAEEISVNAFARRALQNSIVLCSD